MNRYFTVRNCVIQEVTPANPWEFDVSHVRFDWDDDPVKSKIEYKRHYFKNATANHCLFSMVRGILPSTTVTSGNKGDNPAAEVFGFVGDYDATVGSNIIENLQANPPGPYLPTRWSLTQGNNFRLIWEFESGLNMESSAHCDAFLEEVARKVQAQKWGAMFDRTACTNCAQHFDVGRKWGEFSDQRIATDILKLWDYSVYTKLRSQTKVTFNIPFEAINEEAQKQFPGRIDFIIADGQRCYRFWDPASDNRDGCVITKDGVRVFVPHDKPFMSWGDIFGHAFVDKYVAAKSSPVISHIWFNNMRGNFVRWKENDRKYVTRDVTTLKRDLAAEVGLKAEKKRGDTLSEVDTAIHEITSRREVDCAVPVIFYPHGPLDIDGRNILNTSVLRVSPPSDSIFIPDNEHWRWANRKAYEAFPFIYGVISTMFEQDAAKAKERLDNQFAEPIDEEDNYQLKVFLSWLSSFYSGAATLNPTQGQCLVIAGPKSVGKSLLATEIIGALFGGAVDASRYYVEASRFTGGIFKSGVHVIDDKICELDHKARSAFTTKLKVTVATARLDYEEKFENAVPSVPWLGRIIITCNMDAKSLSILPDLEQSNSDKITMIKMGPYAYPFYPAKFRKKNIDSIMRDMPNFARFLLQYERDPELADVRMGVKAYQHPEMRAAAAENGYTNVVIDALHQTIDTLTTLDPAGKIKASAGKAILCGNARYIFDRISDVSKSAAKDIGGARQLAAILSQMEAKHYNIRRSKLRGSWLYEIPADFEKIDGEDVA